jgi:hypothetical protein
MVAIIAVFANQRASRYKVRSSKHTVLPVFVSSLNYLVIYKCSRWPPPIESPFRPNSYCLSSVAWVRKRTIPTERPPLVEVSANFCGHRVHVVRVTDSYGRILDFLDWRGWVEPVPDPLLLTKSGSAGNRTRTSTSVARNSCLLDHIGGQFLLLAKGNKDRAVSKFSKQCVVC